MAMEFEELDDTTRRHMLTEFEAEEATDGYRAQNLSDRGRAHFPELMRTALSKGDEQRLQVSLAQPAFWRALDRRSRRINISYEAERLALTEFNTWYIRGFSKRLLDEGHAQCQVYRAARPRGEPASCQDHEGRIFQVAEVYAGHRAHYWPLPGDSSKLMIPFSPNCHHSIRRVRDPFKG